MNRMINISKVSETAEIGAVATLAREIWEEHYTPIIGQEQTRYMLANFQSPEAIARQMAEGYLYFIVRDGGQDVGYFAVVAYPENQNALLSKIYVKNECRGWGYGKAMVWFAERLSAEMGLRELWLTVNRRNFNSIAFYESVGLAITGEIVQEIGSGFVMDDYRMAKAVEPKTAHGSR